MHEVMVGCADVHTPLHGQEQTSYDKFFECVFLSGVQLLYVSFSEARLHAVGLSVHARTEVSKPAVRATFSDSRVNVQRRIAQALKGSPSTGVYRW